MAKKKKIEIRKHPPDVIDVTPKILADMEKRLTKISRKKPILPPSPRARKKCPVCKIPKVYTGPICPSCVVVGFRVQPNGRIKRKIDLTTMSPKQIETSLNGHFFKKGGACANCGAGITLEQKKHNAGYCHECAFEAWGEGDPE